MSTEAGHEYTDDPVCPWCDAEQGDAWEIGGGEEGECGTACDSCGKAMVVSRHVSVSYSTRRDEAEQVKLENYRAQRDAKERCKAKHPRAIGDVWPPERARLSTGMRAAGIVVCEVCGVLEAPSEGV